ncbi:MAG: type IV pilus secretin PilQ [Pseudomonadota bacterium]
MVKRILGWTAGLALAFWMGCGGVPAPKTASEAASPAGPNALSSMDVKEDGGVTKIMIAGSQPMSPNIFKLTEPDRIIIDLTNTKLGTVTGPIQVNKGGVNQITVDQFDDGTGSLSRIVVGLNEPLEYQVESDRNALTLKVTRGTSQQESSLPASPQAGFLPSAPGMEATSPGVVEPTVPAALEEPTASRLDDVQYSSSPSGTLITLVTNGAVKDFNDFYLKNPSRLVVDLAGLKNKYVGGKSVPLNTSEVKGIRLGRSGGKLRVAIDLASDEKPAYTMDKSGHNLIINVSAVAAPTETAAAPAPETLPTAPQEAPAVSEAVPSLPPVEAAQVSAPAPAVEAAPAPAPETAPEFAPIPEAKAAGPVYVTSLAFRQLKDAKKSRISIGLSGSQVDYTSREEEPGKVVVEISNAKLRKKILKREFNTREFETAVLSVTPRVNAKARKVSFVVALEQQVPYTVSQEGDEVYVDVDVPPRILRARTPDLAQAPAAEDPQATPAEAVATADTNGGKGLGARELILESEKMAPAEGAPPLGKRDYRYVKESFMNDATISNEPLSDMGAILAGEVQGRRFTGRRISLDFKDADIRSIFRLLADISKLNLIISDDVGGHVTVRLENVPWDQAFAIILQTKGLWFEKYGNIVRIAPADKLRAEKELAAAAARAAQAAKPLDVLFKPVSYATAADMMKQVRTVLTDRGTVDIDSRTNTLIIKDIRENLEKAKHLVEILDTQTPQVSIESRIVEANTTYTRSFGIIWGGQANFSSKTGNPTGVFFPNSVGLQGLGAGAGTKSFSGLPVALNYPSPLGVNAGIGIRLGSINNILDLDLALGLLETEGHAKLISSPKVTVLDNETANIQAGSKIPFLTQTANAGSNVRFEEATTSLDVTPHITNDGAISMKIAATRNEPNFAQLVQGNPLVDQRMATTKVLVKSGNTTVLGGIYSIRTSSTKDSLPGVSSIPIIGWLFRNYTKEISRTELLIFVTPRIVGDEREAVKDIRG